MAKHSNLVWTTIDPTTLPAPIAKQYGRYKEAYAEMKAERKALEDALDALIPAPAGQQLVIGHNFGKLSFAFAPAETKPAAKGSMSLSAFLASHAASGRRS